MSILFRDVDGDVVCGAGVGGRYILGDDGEVPNARLTPCMARALAADMIAWADSVDAQTAPLSPIPYETARERLDSAVEKHSITERGTT